MVGALILLLGQWGVWVYGVRAIVSNPPFRHHPIQDLSGFEKENKQKISEKCVALSVNMAETQKMLFQVTNASNSETKDVVGRYCLITRKITDRTAVFKNKKKAGKRCCNQTSCLYPCISLDTVFPCKTTPFFNAQECLRVGARSMLCAPSNLR